MNPFAWLTDLVYGVPLPVVRGLFLAVFAALALWVLCLPAQQPESEPHSRWTDLRFFALLVLVLQSLLYIVF